MKNTSSFARLWSYLKVYKFAVAFAIFLKILSVIISVVEPFVMGDRLDVALKRGMLSRAGPRASPTSSRLCRSL